MNPKVRRKRKLRVRPRMLALAIAQGLAASAQAASITVNSASDISADDGLCTLREAIVSANSDTVSGAVPGECSAGSESDLIQFDPSLVGQTITLTAADAAGQIDITSRLTIQGPGARDLTISGNSNSRLFEVSAAGDATLNNLTLQSGRANFGGAVFNQGRLRLSESIVTGNTATVGNGGAINSIGLSLVVARSTLYGNRAFDYGGGVYTRGYTNAITSTFSGNQARFGGAIHADDDTLRLSNSTLSDNTAFVQAGGIRVGSTGTLRMTASIVANSEGADCSNSGSMPTNVANLVEDGSCGAEITGDPGLRDLADNGGPTPTHAFFNGFSRAVDPDVFAPCSGTDQRGFPRTVDGDGDGEARCDTGAYEYLPPLVVDTTTLIAADGDCGLPEAVANANADSPVHPDCPRGFGEDVITFSPVLEGSTITLTGANADIDVTSPVTIQGPGADLLALSGDGSSRVFFVDDGRNGESVDVAIQGLTLQSGLVSGDGGAVLNRENLTLSDVTLTSNEASRGGAVFSDGPGDLTLVRATISQNRTESSGSGILASDSAVTVIDSTVSGNTSSYGSAAIRLIGGSLEMRDSTISGNRVYSTGGIFARSSSVQIRNSTIIGNSTIYGGGSLYVDAGEFGLINVVIAGNTGEGLECLYSSGTGSSVFVNTGNLVEDGSCNSTLAGDPLLGPLQHNGGPTLTHAPLPGSPVIDTGDDSICTATDQRGAVRPGDGDEDGLAGCDIGAVELITPVRVTTASIEQTEDGLCSLPEALANVNADSRVFDGQGECLAGFGPDRIVFDPGMLPNTITLQGSHLLISSSVTVEGPGARQLTIDGADASRIFDIDRGGSGDLLDVMLQGLTLTNGNADQGGAVRSAENLVVQSSVISNSRADRGGGIHQGGTATLSIIDSTIAGNTATLQGGGIDHVVYSETLTLMNSTVSGNTASGRGGGVYNSGGGDVLALNSTVFGNTAAYGGGLENLGTFGSYLGLVNTIVAGNSGGDCNSPNSITPNNSSLVEDGSCVALFFGFPNLGPLQDNGGPTPTHNLPGDSMVRDAGDNRECPARDQRGIPRNDGACDLGAVEFSLTIFSDGFERIDPPEM